MTMYDLPCPVLAPEGGGGTQNPAGYWAAAHTDHPVFHLEDRGQVGRHVACQAILARQLAIAEPRRSVLQACRSRLPAADGWTEGIGENDVIRVREERLHGLRGAAQEDVECLVVM